MSDATEGAIELDQVRWVHVSPDGNTETDYGIQPTNIPTLRVQIIAVDAATVTERCWTYNGQPPGIGWSFEGREDVRSSTWRRVRLVKKGAVSST